MSNAERTKLDECLAADAVVVAIVLGTGPDADAAFVTARDQKSAGGPGTQLCRVSDPAGTLTAEERAAWSVEDTTRLVFLGRSDSYATQLSDEQARNAGLVMEAFVLAGGTL